MSGKTRTPTASRTTVRPGINGVTVRLLRGRNAGGHDGDGTNAGNAGYYFFTDLLPGDYKVEFVAQWLQLLSSADQGGNDGLDSDATA
jgi:hypothetical protein